MTVEKHPTSSSELLSEEAVQKLAKLARLELSAERAASLQTDLNSILQYAAKLNDVAVENIAPLSHVHGSTNVFREDQREETDLGESILERAPQRSGSFIQVPLVVDSEGEEKG